MAYLRDDDEEPMDEQFRPSAVATEEPEASPEETEEEGGAPQSSQTVGPVNPQAYQQAMQYAPQIDPSSYTAGPATQAYRQMLANQPTLSQYAPSTGRRVVGGVLGLASGMVAGMHGGAGAGSAMMDKVQSNINYGPYQRAASLYQGQMQKAQQLAQTEQAAQAVQRQIPVNQALINQRQTKASENVSQGGYYGSRANEYRPQSLAEKIQVENAMHPERPGAAQRPILDPRGQVVVTMGPDGQPKITPYGQTPGVIAPVAPKPYVSPLDVEDQRFKHNQTLQNSRESAANQRQKTAINARAVKSPNASKPPTPAMQSQAEELANRRFAQTSPDFAKYVDIDDKGKTRVTPPKGGLFGLKSVDPQEVQKFNALLKQRDAVRDQILGGSTTNKKYSIIAPGATSGKSGGTANNEEDPYEIHEEEDEDEQ